MLLANSTCHHRVSQSVMSWQPQMSFRWLVAKYLMVKITKGSLRFCDDTNWCIAMIQVLLRLWFFWWRLKISYKDRVVILTSPWRMTIPWVCSYHPWESRRWGSPWVPCGHLGKVIVICRMVGGALHGVSSDTEVTRTPSILSSSHPKIQKLNTWEIPKNTWSLLSFGPWFFGDEHPSSPCFPWVWIFNFHPNLETFWQFFSWKS